MAESPDPQLEQFPLSITQPGIKGLNTHDDQMAIDDMEMADCRNVFFDDGMVTPRTGSYIFAEKPSGETGNALQLITAVTADQENYLLAIYDSGNIYAWDETNEDWFKINGSFSQANPTLKNGWINWVKGFALDSVYAGNGRDHSWKWPMGIGYLSVAAASGDSQITLSDSRRFPTSGTLLINNGGTIISKTITGNTTATGVITLSATVGANVPSGSAVAMAIVDQDPASKVPLGSLFSVWQSRLLVANAYQAENLFNYSLTNDPENFSTTTGITGAGSFYIIDGNGPITELKDMGQFALIGKKDAWIPFSFQYAADLASKTTLTNPLVTGPSVGPVSAFATIKLQNTIYYPTSLNGIYGLEPVNTNTTSSVKTSLLSGNINQTVTSALSFLKGATAVTDQKLLFACASPDTNNLQSASEIIADNNLVLLYDMQHQAWSFITGWAVEDFATYKSNLYYLNSADGGVYQCFVGQDDNDETYYPYVTYKEQNFGQPAMPKSQDKVCVAGLIDPGTILKVDVMFNRNGALGTQTFNIDGNADYVTRTPVVPLGGNAPLGSNLPLGSGGLVVTQNLANQLSDNTGFFRVYLDIAFLYGFYTLQLKFYSQTQGAYWGILSVSHNPVMAPAIPVELVIGPS